MENSAPFGKATHHRHPHLKEGEILTLNSQVRQGIANNTKGTAFVVYEDVMDAKQACDKLNGFNFQNRYLVGELRSGPSAFIATASLTTTVLYHQPEKMARSKEDLEARKENLEQLKKQHGIE